MKKNKAWWRERIFKKPKEYIIDPTSAKCKKCKARWDLPTIRESKNYKLGICPNCGGFLFSIKYKLN